MTYLLLERIEGNDAQKKIERMSRTFISMIEALNDDKSILLNYTVEITFVQVT